MIKAIFLDRDGTLNIDVEYLHRVSDFEWCKGVIDGLIQLKKQGFVFFVVSNQSGVARGYYGMEDIVAIEKRMMLDLQAVGVEILSFKYCPHLEEISGPCDCRKPKNGLFEDLIKEYNVSRSESWMIGDALRDLLAAEKSGIQGLGVKGRHDSDKMRGQGFRCLANFTDCVNLISQSSSG